jgi:hypothetical protein
MGSHAFLGWRTGPPVVKHKAEAQLKQRGFTPREPPEHGDDFSDKMLDKYGDDWYSATEARELDALMTPVEREAATLLYETPERCFIKIP